LGVGGGAPIENLHIGPLIDNVENTPAESAVVYPNPGNGIIRILDPAFTGKQIRYQAFNSTGELIRSGVGETSEGMAIDISDQPSGLYFIILENTPVRITLKYILIKK
jgi:hypothetical protein